MGDGLGGHAVNRVEELRARVGGAERLLPLVEPLGEEVELGELAAGFDAGGFRGFGAFDLIGEVVEQREPLDLVLVEPGVVEQVDAGADRDVVIGVFLDQETEGGLGFLHLAHRAIGIGDAVSGHGGFMGFRPVVDDRLEAFAQGGLRLLEMHHRVAPHQLGIGRSGAFFVERQEFLILGEGGLELAVGVVLFRDSDLIALDLAHLLEGGDLNLLKRGKRRARGGSRCEEKGTGEREKAFHFAAASHLLYSEWA